MNTEISKSLNGEEILNALDNKCNLITYSDIHKYKTIEELLGKYKKCVILYHTSESYGHWVCCYENNNTIFFFDSYGSKPDSQLKFLPAHLKPVLNSQHNYLIRLMYNSGKDVEFNQYALQKHSQEITTCGRWCVNRLRFPEISVNEYYTIFKQSSNYISNDELICLLVPIKNK